jgi:cyclophilin family peptidyl-prolyl cis-trans isomerase/protein-disulfide isomerase
MAAMSSPINSVVKPALFGLLIAGLLLTACAGANLAPNEEIIPEASSIPTLAGAPEMVCTSVSAGDEQASLADSPFVAVSESDWSRGPEDAVVTIVEYSDFQCPACAALEPAIAELQTRFPEDVRIVYRHFPLIGEPDEPIHLHAAYTAQAAEAAGAQGKFWEMHDLLFARQLEWSSLDAAELESWLLAAAAELELDAGQFATDLNSPELQTLATQAWQTGLEIGLPGTPFLLVNGIPYQGPTDLGTLDALVQLELLSEREFFECPAFEIDLAKQYIATIHTEKGDVVVQLFPEVAPMAVNSFVFLAEHDWFDNVTFHRVIPGFMAQGGDPSGTGYGGPGYTFEIEPSSTLLFDRAGLLAMANSGPTSNGSQFFITYGPAEHLNGGYTIFGEVISGMDVVESLAARDPAQGGNLPPGDLILDVSIEVQ